MIQTIRTFIEKKKNQKALFVGVIGLSLIYSTISFLFQSRISGSVAALVNGHPVTHKEVQRTFARLQDFIRQYGISGLSIDLKKRALETVAYEKVAETAVDDLGVSLSPAFIAKNLNDPLFIMNYLRAVVPPHLIDPQGGIKDKELKAYLKATGMTAAEFDGLLEKNLKQLLLSDIVGSLVSVTQAEVREAYAQKYSQRTYTITTLSLHEFERKAHEHIFSDEELRQFFIKQEALGVYRIGESRSLILWEFPEINAKEKQLFKKKAFAAIAAGRFDAFVAAKKGVRSSKILNAASADPLLSRSFKLPKGKKEFFVQNGKNYALEVVEIEPAHNPSLESIKEKVKKDLYAEKARALAHAAIEDALAKNLSLQGTKEKVTLSSSSSEAVAKKLSVHGIPLARLQGLVIPGSISHGVSETHAYIITLDQLLLQEDDFQKKSAELEKQQEIDAFLQAQRSWFIASLTRSAKIKILNPNGQTEVIEFD